MSVFNRVFDAHKRAKAQLEQEEAARAAAEKAAASEFVAAFMQHVEFVVAPIFGQFARDAESQGFPAKTESSKDESNNLTYTLKFAVVAGSTLGEHPQNECACTLKAIIADRRVELSSHFDKRPGRRVAFKSEIFVLPVVNAVLLERTLGELLVSALDSGVS